MSKTTLWQGDCLDLMKNIESNSIDCIICDLPYGRTACKWDVIIPFEPLWQEYHRILKETGIVILFGSQPFTTKIISSNLDEFRYEYVWVKNNCSNFQLANKQPLKYHENICVFYKDIIQTVFSDIMQVEMKKHGLTQKDLQYLFLSKNGNPTGWVSNKLKGTQIPTAKQWEKLCKVFDIENEYESLLMQIKKHTYNTNTTDIEKIQTNKGKAGSLGHLCSKTPFYVQTQTNYPKSVLYFDRETNIVHPTQKPLNLLKYLVSTYTNEGDLVLDNCMGSGTTGVACKELNRKFIGIEKEQKYFEIAKERIEND